MHIEWDERKAASNLLKHGIPFELARQVLDDPFATSEMDQIVEGEERWRTIGRVGAATILFVAHTWLDADGEVYVRIISARKANKQEVKFYDREISRHFG